MGYLLKMNTLKTIVRLVILDLPLIQWKDGLKKKYKNHKPPPIVMMITAYGYADNYKTAMELEADDFILFIFYW